MAEKTTIARPYAQAVFDVAREQGALQAWSDMLALCAAVAADEQVARLIESPRLTAERLAGFFIDVCADGLNDKGRNLIRLLAENRRLDLLGEIQRLFEALRHQAEGRVQAQLITAFPATGEQKEKVRAALKARFGREVELECITDPTLMGGAVIRAGDMVIDGSVKGRLDKLAGALTH